jgi:DHA2 family methylenomycin A resistance protein-like MFS transporter
MMLWGLAAFAVASAAAGATPSLGVLVAARLGQAIAGSLVFPNALALLREALPAHRRAAGLGLFGSAVGAAAAVGPPLGGALVGAFGWRAIFLVNVPVVAGAAVLTVRALPAGAAAAGVWAPGTAWARPLRSPAFRAATGAVGLSNLAMYTALLAVPVVLADRDGWSAGDAGLALALLSVAMVVLGPFGGRLADAVGHRMPAVTGLALLTAGAALLAAMGATPSAPGLAAALLVAGIGLGLAGAPLQAAALESVDPRDAGVASGLFSTGRYAGSLVAAGLLAALLGGGTAHAGTLFALTAVAAAAATALALRLRVDARLEIPSSPSSGLQARCR